MVLDLRAELERFGALRRDVRLLASASADNIGYLDLVSQPGIQFGRPLSVPVDAVIESSGQAVAYVVRADNLASASSIDPDSLKRLRHDLACRGDAEYLLVWSPGQLQVFCIGLGEEEPTGITVVEADSPFLAQQLANRTFDRHADVLQRAVHAVLFAVLTEVSDTLTKSPALSARFDDVISLIGRALFARFLIDRGIINSETFPEVFDGGGPERCFDNPEFAALTCKWLHDKFNGEMLPLASEDYEQYFEELAACDPAALGHLSRILHRAPGGQLSFELYWNTVNFAHIPVGLLSQVYEHYAHKLFEQGAKEESIYYTPRFVADFMINEAFNGMAREERASTKVLDPAVGAGIFLVLAFRRLVAENWLATGERPDYQVIRRILREQIFGFDINGAALRLTSLSLYLTALELDPNPFPPSKLQFHKLIDSNLFVTRDKGEEYPKTKVLGSLGPGAPAGHDGKYGLVVGNPPWTAWKPGTDADRLNTYVSKTAREIASASGNSETLIRAQRAYVNPDNVPDLPFVWRAMRWAKPGGMIAFALHGRLLFKRKGNGKEARDALFSALKVLAILNGSEHADGFWPGVNQPFCLLFAENSAPEESETFLMLTPDPDMNLIPDGRFRLDYQMAEPVQISVMRRDPTLLKSLAIGTALDADIGRRLRKLVANSSPIHDDSGADCRRNFVSFGDYWTAENRLDSGQGFQVARKQKQRSAQFIIDMGAVHLSKPIAKKCCPGFLVDQSQLPFFDIPELVRPRRPEIYRSPLVLVSEAPGASRDEVRARLVLGEVPVAYTESFYGYSAHDHPNGEMLVRYVFVLFNSSLFVFHALITSAKFGTERRALLEEDIQDFPILPFERLSPEEVNDVRRLSDALIAGPSDVDWNRLEAWVFKLYGLTDYDHQVVADTLATRLPYPAVRRRATEAPFREDAQRFVEALEDEMQPFFKMAGTSIRCELTPVQTPPWIFFDISVGGQSTCVAGSGYVTQVMASLADAGGATRILIGGEGGHLRVGILAQRRYWTLSRARLVAVDLMRQFDHHLLGSFQ